MTLHTTMYRSTKGASKARRDQINAEIRNIKELLPISDSDKARLSYLHIMSLACMYTRKSVFFSQVTIFTTNVRPCIFFAKTDALQDETTDLMFFQELSGLMHELSGFMILLTSDGKLLYLSDNVADHLGHCMVSSRSCKLVAAVVTLTNHTLKVLCIARCLTPPCPVSAYWTSNPVWVCFCTPLKTITPCLTIAKSAPLTPPSEQSFLLACFHSQHHRDMRLWDAQDSVSVYLGYDVEFLRSRSWYSLVHPRDLSHASAQHCLLCEQVDMVVQVEAADHSWVWLYMVLQLNIDENPISCHNYIIRYHSYTAMKYHCVICLLPLTMTSIHFGGDECSIMGLPQISGPLYVDVPHRPFRGPLNELLTPEASPTHPPCSFFSTEKEQEQEREDISLLAKYISSLAEGFYCDPLLPRVTPSTFSSSPSLQATSQNPSPPCGAECPPWRGLDPPLSREDISLYEESMALESLIEELSTFPLSPSSCSSPPSSSFNSFPPCLPLTPVSRCNPSLFKGESSIGVNHFCSVQSTQCNYMAVGGAMMAVGAGIKRDMEESSESEMDTDVSVSLPSSAIALTAFQECVPVYVHPAPTTGLPHAQSLLEELDAIESVFEADVSFNPSRGDNLSCINSHSTIHSQSFHQGTGHFCHANILIREQAMFPLAHKMS
uniref:Neuronal PAS domain protein 4 n=1 Tax=Hucho hucho TaxID=62062 RepID=A0A4W5MR70_9TELE